MFIDTAKVTVREERRSQRDTCAANDPALLMPPLFAMTWVPAWFVPVFFAESRSCRG